MAQDINNFIDPKLISSLEQINQQLILAGGNIDKLVPLIKALETAQKGLGKTVTTNKTARKKLTAEQKEAAGVAKRLETVQAKLNQLSNEQHKKLLQLQEAQRKQLALLKAEAKVKNAAKGSNEKLAATIGLYEKRLQAVNRTTVKGRAEAAKLTKQIDLMNNKLTKQSSALTKTKRGIGGYASAMKGVAMQFAGALGLTSLVFMFVNVLKGSFNTIREFTKQNAVLAGVLGKTRKEIGQLTDQAIQLGSIYPVTASEVNKLQVSYARLGFTQQEIISLTEATILGSIALNSELDATATLVGAVVKAYGDLTTLDAPEIVDKLTIATQKSSLSFSGLQTALPKVAAASNAMNIPLSKTWMLRFLVHRYGIFI